MRRNEGFTLVELLIVLAVIAALLATITPVALNAVKKAKATQVAENLRNIKTAIEQYVYVEQATPSEIQDLIDEHYLSADPGNSYDIDVGGLTGATALATIVYKGQDVDADKVNQVFPEATEASTDIGSLVKQNDIYVQFTIAKYW